MKMLYLDCFGGISGDMTVGALLDAGVPAGYIEEQIRLLGLEGYALKVYKTRSHGFSGTRFAVEVDQGHQPPRTWGDIAGLIGESPLHPQVKKNALLIFETLARAEGKVHGVEAARVHFHELGAVDSLVAIVGTAAALHAAGVEEVYTSPLPAGYGCVQTRHGLLPVPAPAAAELMKGFPVRPVPVEGELVTPTGAAVVAALAKGSGLMPAMKIKEVGYGLGSKDYGLPNFLRVFLGEGPAPAKTGEDAPPGGEQAVSVLETGIDDLSPEILAYVAERLFSEGALDVYLTPAVMKKGRPGTLVAVLCPPEKENALAALIFAETSTLGVRVRRERRFCIPRREVEVESGYGPVRVKIAGRADDSRGRQISPEYEDCRRLAREKDVPVKEIYRAAVRAAEEKFPDGSP
ncbi:MAG: nickel pincer cofactor biosynthesis protein LarC [Desulfotomaculales bacterium]